MDIQGIKLPPSPPLVDRVKEFSIILEGLKKAISNEGSLVLIGGEGGIGKSKILYEGIRTSPALGVKPFLGKCNHTPLTPLSPFQDAFGTISPNPINTSIISPEIEAIYFIGPSGLLITKIEKSDSKIDPSLLTSMYEIIFNFVHTSINVKSSSTEYDISGMDFGNVRFYSIKKNKIGLIFVLHGKENSLLEEDAKNTLKIIEEQYKTAIDNWNGDITQLKEARVYLEKLINHPAYNGKEWGVSTGAGRDLIFNYILHNILEIAKNNPIMICLDDLQWADETSLDFIQYMVPRISNKPIFFVGTYRTEEVADNSKLKETIGILSREPNVIRIMLQHLETEDGIKLAKGLLNKDIDDAIVNNIYEESEGNPFYLIELIKVYQQEGTFSKSHIHATIPQKIYDIIKYRINKLDKKKMKILEIAAIVGLEFNLSDIEIFIQDNRYSLLEDIRELIELQFIRERREHYRFFHAKIREVVLSEMPISIQKEMHKQYAIALEKAPLDVMEKAFKIAYHYLESGDAENGYKYVLSAGDIAKSKYAYPEVINLYKKCIETLNENLDADKKYILLERLGEAYKYCSMWENALSVTVEQMLLPVVMDKDIRKIKSLIKQGEVYAAMNLHQNAKESFERALENALQINEPSLVISAMRGMGYSLWREGKIKDSAKYYNDALKIATSIKEETMIASLQIDLGNINLSAGNIAGSLEYYLTALNYLSSKGDSPELGRVYNNLGSLYSLLNDWKKALDMHEMEYQIASRISKSDLMAWALYHMSYVYVMLGDYDTANDLNEKALKISSWIGDKIINSYCKINSLHISIKKGNALNDDDLNKIFEDIKNFNVPEITANAANNIARVYEEYGDKEKALGYYNKAYEIYSSLNSVYYLELLKNKVKS